MPGTGPRPHDPPSRDVWAFSFPGCSRSNFAARSAFQRARARVRAHTCAMRSASHPAQLPQLRAHVARGRQDQPDDGTALGPFALAYKRALRRQTRSAKADMVASFYVDPRARRIVEAAAHRASLADRVDEIRQELAFLLHTRFVDMLLDNRGTPLQTYSFLYTAATNACRTLRKTLHVDWARHMSLDDDFNSEVVELLEQTAVPGRPDFSPEAVEARIDTQRAGLELSRRLALLRPQQAKGATPTPPSARLPRIAAHPPRKAAALPDAPKQEGQASNTPRQAAQPQRRGAASTKPPVVQGAVVSEPAGLAPVMHPSLIIGSLPIAVFAGAPSGARPGTHRPAPVSPPTPPILVAAPGGMLVAWDREGVSPEPRSAAKVEMRQQLMAIHLRWADGLPTQEYAHLFAQVSERLDLGRADLSKAMGVSATAYRHYAGGKVERIPRRAVAKIEALLQKVQEQERAAANSTARNPLAWEDVELLPLSTLLGYWARLLGAGRAGRQEQDRVLCELFTAHPIRRLRVKKGVRAPVAVTPTTLAFWRGELKTDKALGAVARRKLHATVLRALAASA